MTSATAPRRSIRMRRTLLSEAARVTFRLLRRGLNVLQEPIQLNFFAILLNNRRNLANWAAISRSASCAASVLGRAFHHAVARRKTGLLPGALRHGSLPP